MRTAGLKNQEFTEWGEICRDSQTWRLPRNPKAGQADPTSHHTFIFYRSDREVGGDGALLWSKGLRGVGGTCEKESPAGTPEKPGDSREASLPGTHEELRNPPGVDPHTTPCSAAFRTRLPRRYPCRFPLTGSPFLHASRLPPSLAFGFR